MLPLIAVALAGSACGLLVYELYEKVLKKTPLPTNAVTNSVTGNPTVIKSIAGITLSTPLTMIQVPLPNGEIWEVTSDYVAGPVGINEASTIVKGLGLELPSIALVDAIWRQADLKLPPKPRNNIISQAVFDDQQRVIAEQKSGKTFTLVGGQFKDVVNNAGHVEIYGWHCDVEHGATVPGVPLLSPRTPGPGKIIQPPSGKAHDQSGPIGFKDYSQGARGVRRIA